MPQYYIEDNHEAIIPLVLFYKVQEEKARRASLHKPAVSRKKNKLKKEKSKFRKSVELKEVGRNYQNRNKYAEEISWEEIISSLEYLLYSQDTLKS